MAAGKPFGSLISILIFNGAIIPKGWQPESLLVEYGELYIIMI